MAGKTDFMLTTFDNPFNPFKQFEAWYKYDMILGYNCCGLLANNAGTSDVFSDERNQEITVSAMKEICERNPFVYKMVSSEED